MQNTIHQYPLVRLNLTPHISHTTIVSSLAWNAIRDSLMKLKKGELLSYIESVKVTNTRITIKTGKPIVNMELSHYTETIKERIEESFQTCGIPKQERKIVFI